MTNYQFKCKDCGEKFMGFGDNKFDIKLAELKAKMWLCPKCHSSKIVIYSDDLLGNVFSITK